MIQYLTMIYLYHVEENYADGAKIIGTEILHPTEHVNTVLSVNCSFGTSRVPLFRIQNYISIKMASRSKQNEPGMLPSGKNQQ